MKELKGNNAKAQISSGRNKATSKWNYKQLTDCVLGKITPSDIKRIHKVQESLLRNSIQE